MYNPYIFSPGIRKNKENKGEDKSPLKYSKMCINKGKKGKNILTSKGKQIIYSCRRFWRTNT